MPPYTGGVVCQRVLQHSDRLVTGWAFLPSMMEFPFDGTRLLKYAFESTLPHDRESTAEKNQQIGQKAGLARIFEIELDFLRQQRFDVVVPQVLLWNLG